MGFTGGRPGGGGLCGRWAPRPDPSPFLGGLGSGNPVFLLPDALANRAEQIAAGWAASLTNGAGQFCTNPGIIVALDGPQADAFTAAAHAALAPVGAQTMLTDGIALAYREGRDRIAAGQGVTPVLTTDSQGRQASPYVYLSL